MLRTLWFVSPKGRNEIGIITSVSSYISIGKEKIYQASIHWISKIEGLKVAWWTEDELDIIDSLNNIINNESSGRWGHGNSEFDQDK